MLVISIWFWNTFPCITFHFGLLVGFTIHFQQNNEVVALISHYGESWNAVSTSQKDSIELYSLNHLELFIAIVSLSALSPWLHASLKAGNIP
jgi:hypothetical protein